MKRPKKKILLNNKRIKYTIYALIPITGIFLIWAFCYLFVKLIFTENKRFIIKTVNISSRGNLENKKEKIYELLGIEKGVSSNLTIDTEEMRKKILDIPSVENVQIIKQYPSTLNIKIYEKIPKATLFSRRSKFVIDYECQVMDKTHMGNSYTPLIVGLNIDSKKLKFGDYLTEIKPAMNILKEIKEKYPKFKITKIDLSDKNKIEFKLFANRKIYTVIILKDDDKKEALEKISYALQDTNSKKERPRTIDTSYEDIIIVK